MFILCSCSGSGSDGSPTGLREIKWGIDRTEVRKIEQAEFVGYDENFIRFYDKDMSQPIVNMGVNTRNKVDLWYYFNSDDKLFKIEYRVSSPTLNDIAYDIVKDGMTELYGKPYEEDVVAADSPETRITSWKSYKSDIKLSYYIPEKASVKYMYVTFLPNN